MRLERHEPVERREGDREAVRQEAARAQHLHPPREPGVAGLVLLERPGVQKIGERIPDGEINRGADEEERDAQIELLVPQHLVVGDEAGVGPAIEMMRAERDR